MPGWDSKQDCGFCLCVARLGVTVIKRGTETTALFECAVDGCKVFS